MQRGSNDKNSILNICRSSNLLQFSQKIDREDKQNTIYKMQQKCVHFTFTDCRDP